MPDLPDSETGVSVDRRPGADAPGSVAVPRICGVPIPVTAISIATIQVFDEVDEAIGIANASDYGLVSYVWSDDLPSVMRISQRVRAGTVWVNSPMARDLRAPFGGYKKSGIGRDGLPGSIELFTEEKTTMVPLEPLDLPRLGLGSAAAEGSEG